MHCYIKVHWKFLYISDFLKFSYQFEIILLNVLESFSSHLYFQFSFLKLKSKDALLHFYSAVIWHSVLRNLKVSMNILASSLCALRVFVNKTNKVLVCLPCKYPHGLSWHPSAPNPFDLKSRRLSGILGDRPKE